MLRKNLINLITKSKLPINSYLYHKKYKEVYL